MVLGLRCRRSEAVEVTVSFVILPDSQRAVIASTTESPVLISNLILHRDKAATSRVSQAQEYSKGFDGVLVYRG